MSVTSRVGGLIAAAALALSVSTLAPLAQAPAHAVTFDREVAPIFFKNCASCHRPGESTPMWLTTYKDARPWARAIRRAVVERAMPPWGADPQIGSFANDPSLSAADVATIAAWVDAGAVEGDARDLPPAPTFADGWKIGKPDRIIAMTSPASIPAGGPRIIRDFPIDEATFAEDTYIERLEVVPGNRAVTHHAIVSVVDADGSRRIGGFQPGGLIAEYPHGVVRLIPKGTALNLNMHYNPNGAAATDTTRIALVFARGPVEKVAITGMSGTRALDIPPGEANYEAIGTPFTFAEDSHIVGLLPRMNERGKDYRYTLVYPDGRSLALLSVPKFDDNWQPNYIFRTPVAAPKGSRVETIAHYDNSPGNRRNPDPTARVPYGPEIMNGYIDYTLDRQDLRKQATAPGR